MTNQEPKPSPGPWKYEQSHLSSDGVEFRLTTEHGQTLGWVYDSEANARLIAQAPETAQLLRELVEGCQHMKHDLQTRGGEVELRGMQLAEAVYELWLAPTLEKIAKLEGGDDA